MDVNLINPFIDSFGHVMGQLGFSDIKRGNISVKGQKISGAGVVLAVGIVGQIKGNVVYIIDLEDAKKIASKMMMGMPIAELDEMSRSCLAELSNMLSANAATGFSKAKVLVDISPPSFYQGENISINMSSGKVICVQLIADGILVEVNISFE